jgi:heme-degrading monooxygenase HmoA
MFARVSSYHADQDTAQLLEGFQDTIGPLQLLEGFSQAYFLVDPQTDTAVSITIWEDEDAMSASAPGGEERRRHRAEAGSATVESVDTYHVSLLAMAPGVRPAGRNRHPAHEPGEELY